MEPSLSNDVTNEIISNDKTEKDDKTSNPKNTKKEKTIKSFTAKTRTEMKKRLVYFRLGFRL